MKIETGNVATIAYDITTAEGEIVESSDISGPIAILVGAQSMIPGLDKRLVGLDVGAEETFEIPPEEAFGTEEDAPTNVVSRAEFPKDAKLEVGQKFQANMPNGTTLTLAIREISDDTVTTAMIHPLAGKTLSVSVKIISVRAATSKETEAGRAMVTPPPPPPKK
ncbi:peptidylprolyl isomerase, FKBP-type [Plesiocystis pacifica SIR-1]|uniref:Peptidyl-prolyl cis-trans isomerase n=1 Tax=Plesiocystis pacifica SIR-1 TaxID=391625 RepID=A6GI50_9BACT|nr:peptidylprolyl isomerase [Plesiocystis pacifica]EDM74437.1 peptidylprolyl isomerase, FKBP-type [Plesiocystis pacifica SIR-1]